MRIVHAFASASCFSSMFYLSPLSGDSRALIGTVLLGLVGTWLLIAAVVE